MERDYEVKRWDPAPGIYTVTRAHQDFPIQVVVLNELADAQTAYMFAPFLTGRGGLKEAASTLLVKKYLEDEGNKDLEQLVDFLLENELVAARTIEEVWNMVRQAVVEERQKIIELFDRHPFGQELKKRFMEQGLQQGKLEETRTAILDYLESRFNQRPAGVDAALDTIGDLERLKKLRREVFQADTLEAALAVIAQATNGAGEH